MREISESLTLDRWASLCPLRPRRTIWVWSLSRSFWVNARSLLFILGSLARRPASGKNRSPEVAKKSLLRKAYSHHTWGDAPAALRLTEAERSVCVAAGPPVKTSHALFPPEF